MRSPGRQRAAGKAEWAKGKSVLFWLWKLQVRKGGGLPGRGRWQIPVKKRVSTGGITSGIIPGVGGEGVKKA